MKPQISIWSDFEKLAEFNEIYFRKLFDSIFVFLVLHRAKDPKMKQDYEKLFEIVNQIKFIEMIDTNAIRLFMKKVIPCQLLQIIETRQGIKIEKIRQS